MSVSGNVVILTVSVGLGMNMSVCESDYGCVVDGRWIKGWMDRWMGIKKVLKIS